MQHGTRDSDNLITCASQTISGAECEYATMDREGLALTYALSKYRNNLLGGHFKMITNHLALKHLGNKPVLGGKVCRWPLLFQEYNVEIISTG